MSDITTEKLEAVPSIPSDGFECFYLRADGVEIGTINGPQRGEQEQRARRIVACVNACDGIPSEQLELGGAAFIRLMNERTHLKQQRDALLSAYQVARDAILNGRGALESVLDNYSTNAVLSELDDAFDAAIAKDSK